MFNLYRVDVDDVIFVIFEEVDFKIIFELSDNGFIGSGYGLEEMSPEDRENKFEELVEGFALNFKFIHNLYETFSISEIVSKFVEIMEKHPEFNMFEYYTDSTRDDVESIIQQKYSLNGDQTIH